MIQPTRSLALQGAARRLARLGAAGAGVAAVLVIALACTSCGGAGKKGRGGPTEDLCQRFCERSFDCGWKQWHGDKPQIAALRKEYLVRCRGRCPSGAAGRAEIARCAGLKDCAEVLRCVQQQGEGGERAIPAPTAMTVLPEGAHPARPTAGREAFCAAYDRRNAECMPQILRHLHRDGREALEKRIKTRPPAEQAKERARHLAGQAGLEEGYRDALTGARFVALCRRHVKAGETAKVEACFAHRDCAAYVACLLGKPK